MPSVNAINRFKKIFRAVGIPLTIAGAILTGLFVWLSIYGIGIMKNDAGIVLGIWSIILGLLFFVALCFGVGLIIASCAIKPSQPKEDTKLGVACPKCGYVNRSNDIYCSKCGVKL